MSDDSDYMDGLNAGADRREQLQRQISELEEALVWLTPHGEIGLSTVWWKDGYVPHDGTGPDIRRALVEAHSQWKRQKGLP